MYVITSCCASVITSCGAKKNSEIKSTFVVSYNVDTTNVHTTNSCGTSVTTMNKIKSTFIVSYSVDTLIVDVTSNHGASVTTRCGAIQKYKK